MGNYEQHCDGLRVFCFFRESFSQFSINRLICLPKHVLTVIPLDEMSTIKLAWACLFVGYILQSLFQSYVDSLFQLFSVSLMH